MTLPAYTGTLAPAHDRLIAHVGDQWAATVLSTDPVDRVAAVEAVGRLYATHKLGPAPLTIWMDSPFGCIYAAAVIGKLTQTLRSQLVNELRRSQVRHELGRPLWFALAEQLRVQLADRLGERFHAPLTGALEEQFSGLLRGPQSSQLWDQLRGQVRGKFFGQLWALDELRDQCGGDLKIRLGAHGSWRGEDEDWDEDWDEERDREDQWSWNGARSWDRPGHLHSVFPWSDAYGLAFDGCALPIAGRSADPCLSAVSSVVAATGWLIPLPGVAVVGARPAALRRDARSEERRVGKEC